MFRRFFFALLSVLGLAVVWWWIRPSIPAASDEPPRRPAEWGWLQRTFPHFQADPGAYRAAYEQAQALRGTAKADPFGTWRLAGPTNIGGRVVDVAFDPQTPSTLYAAAATGGVFKSTDAGQTWQPIFDDQPVLSIGDLVVDPNRPQTLYVGTGEANGGHNNFAGGGVYRSDDGGGSWRFLGLEATVSIGRVLVDPGDSQRVFVAAAGSYFAPHPERGVYRSDDGGFTWQHRLAIDETTGVVDLAMQPGNPRVLLAAAWDRLRTYATSNLAGPNSGLYRSTDGGDTWQRLGSGTGLPTRPTGRIGVAFCESAPNVAYALYTNGSNYLGLYRSDDGGLSWRDADPDREISLGTGGFSWYFGQVRCHPTDPDQVYAMDVLFMTSTDGGNTWQYQSGTHVDHHALAFHPADPNIVVNGNDGGIALSGDSGRTWRPVADLPVTQFYEIAIDPSNPERRYGGTQDNGTVRTLGETATGAWRVIYGGDGFYVLIDPTNPDVIYAESQFGLLGKSVDGGLSFRGATEGIDPEEPRNWSTPVVMDPTDSQVLYYGTNRLYRTTDGAVTWQPISPDLTKGLGVTMLGTVTTIAVAPTDPDVIYVGLDDGNVWVTDDRGATWHDVTRSLPMRWVTRVVVDPTDAHTAYATFSGLKWRDPQPHVFRTTDRGATWLDLSANLPDAPVNALAVDPSFPDVLYLGSDVGAFASLDGGEHWQALGSGLPNVVVNDLKVFDDGRRRFIAAGTHGRSMYTLELPDLSSPPTATDEQPLPGALTLAQAYPNPFAHYTTIGFTLPEAASVRLEIFDVQGRRVATLADGHLEAGSHRVTWEAAGTAPGTYLARLHARTGTGETGRTVSLTVVR